MCGEGQGVYSHRCRVWEPPSSYRHCLRYSKNMHQSLGTAQWVRYLQGKHEDLSSNSQHACKKLGVAIHLSPQHMLATSLAPT